MPGIRFDFGLLSRKLITVDNTAGGKSLETLLGEALSPTLSRLTLGYVTPGDTVYLAYNEAASASSPPLLGAGEEFYVKKAGADLLRLYAASDVDLVVIQEG